MQFRFILPLVLLSGCENVEQSAGVAGPNPVVAITYEKTTSDPYSSVRLSIGKDGVSRFEGETLDGASSRRHQIGSSVFRKALVDLRHWRTPAGTTLKARDCGGVRVFHAPRERVTWSYQDRRTSAYYVEECSDRAGDFNRALQSLTHQLRAEQWMKDFYAGRF